MVSMEGKFEHLKKLNKKHLLAPKLEVDIPNSEGQKYT